MKKQVKLLILMAFMVLAVVSCKKDDDGAPDPYSAPYTTEDPDDSKANVEDQGIAFIDEMSDMAGATAFEVLANLQDITDDGSVIMSGNKTLDLLKINPENGVESLVGNLKAATADPTSLTEAWDQAVGTYEWNFTTEEFDFDDGGTEVIFMFPGKATDDENTATITISNFAVMEVDGIIYEYPIEDWDPELPTKVKVTLAYDEETLATIDFTASYTAEGLPKSVTGKLTIEDFVVTITATHSPYSSASFTFNLKRGSALLMETFMAAKGNWSEENIEDSEGPEDVIYNANAHFILMNIKVAGKVDFENLAPVIEEIEDEYLDEYGYLIDPNDAEDYADAMVDAINDHVQLVVVYTDSNKKIAEAEAYVYYDDYYDEYEPSVRFIYADGSKESMEEFAADQLDDFFVALNDFIDDLNTEYGIGIPNVGPSTPVK